MFAGLTVALIASVDPTATSPAADTDNVGFLTVIVAFNVFFTAFFPFLPVTLTIFSYSMDTIKWIK